MVLVMCLLVLVLVLNSKEVVDVLVVTTKRLRSAAVFNLERSNPSHSHLRLRQY
jgi:hypothetical protein